MAKRTKGLTVRLTPAEYDDIKTLAWELHTSSCALIRKTMLNLLADYRKETLVAKQVSLFCYIIHVDTCSSKNN